MEKVIILASGLGVRMRPITDHTPKPLVKINGRSLIETIIEGFQKRGIDETIVVVGYMAEKFSYLATKYENTRLIFNPHYADMNNIASLYAARKYLENGSCFICEADLFLMDDAILRKEFNQSCYFAAMVPGVSEDWVFHTDEKGRICQIGRGGIDCYNMAGISYFTEKDAKTLSKILETECLAAENRQMFWDEAVNRHIGEFRLVINEVSKNQIAEIDTADDLERIRERLRRESGNWM